MWASAAGRCLLLSTLYGSADGKAGDKGAAAVEKKSGDGAGCACDRGLRRGGDIYVPQTQGV